MVGGRLSERNRRSQFLFFTSFFRHAPADGDRLADDFEKIQGRLFAEEIGLDHERTAHLLSDANAFEQQLVLAQRRGDGNGTIFLSVRHRCEG